MRRALGDALRDRRPLRGLDALWTDARDALVMRLRRTDCRVEAARVRGLEEEFARMADACLDEALSALRAAFRRGRETDDEIVRAVAAMGEVAWRELGQRPHAGQVHGALALARGRIAEIATGEGKTLCATIPATLWAWRGRGCHVVTANDYLAQRDAAWMAPVYRRAGLRVASIAQETGHEERREAYSADLTYCTGKEAAADYLRDRLVLGRGARASWAAIEACYDAAPARWSGVVQRGLACAVVDEADAVLIDEAATPLIIAGGAADPGLAHAHRLASVIVGELREGEHYKADRAARDVRLTRSGLAKVQADGALASSAWSTARRREEVVTHALSARLFYKRGAQYSVRDGRIVIIDESTGRATPDRSWREGVHQAIEAKEGLAPNAPPGTLARISFQRFFRLYPRLCGMTGTAHEVRRECWRLYRLAFERVPTHRPSARDVLPQRVYAGAEGRRRAVVAEAMRVRDKGRPVLIGVRTVRESEAIASMLRDAGAARDVLNAERHEEEAAVVARAGEAGRITVATNMAGRGTDIALGEGVAAAGGLHVICAEANPARRLDRQLAGRCARQGDPGSYRRVVSLDDEVVLRHAPRALRLACIGGVRWASRATVRSAQSRAEAEGRRRRAGVLRADDWLDDHLGFAAGG
ncbi:MAG: hypothetical protein EA379_08585 [Phycisphaerales bacterium]|nr:MAG: hypothetical protein EA379_08585 [Phycisphaerales bacterium]